MAWIYLLLAGICEIGWPLGLKLSRTTDQRWGWIGFAVLSMAASGALLWLAQRTIPIGTAIAVWTGIGAFGAFIVGILLFRDSTDWLRILSIVRPETCRPAARCGTRTSR